jgi:hypothetical protein
MNFFEAARADYALTDGVVRLACPSIFMLPGFSLSFRRRAQLWDGRDNPAPLPTLRAVRQMKLLFKNNREFLDFLVDLRKFLHLNSIGYRQIPCSCENRDLLHKTGIYYQKRVFHDFASFMDCFKQYFVENITMISMFCRYGFISCVGWVERSETRRGLCGESRLCAHQAL